MIQDEPAESWLIFLLSLVKAHDKMHASIVGNIMPVVNKDEFGLWMDQGYGAIRPSAPSAFREGDEIDIKHFGGSTLYGVGKVSGRGRYREAWLSAPESRVEFELSDAKKLRAQIGEGQVDFDFSWECYLRDLAVLARGNPGRVAGLPEGEDISSLKRARESYMARVGYTMGLMGMRVELIAEGKALNANMLALLEAKDLEGAAEPGQEGKMSLGLRI